MMKRLATILIGLFTAISLYSQELPVAWTKGGTLAGSYQISVEKGKGINGSQAMSIQGIGTEIYGSGLLKQSITAVNYAGKKIRFGAWVKTENVKFWTTLFVANTVDYGMENWNEKGESFEKEKLMSGTQDWTYIEIEKDIDYTTHYLSLGCVLFGEGKVFIDNAKIEVIGILAPKPNTLPSEPLNLDMESMQQLSASELGGYTIQGDKVIFMFDPMECDDYTSSYGMLKTRKDLKIKEVYVSGAFNNWKEKDKAFLMQAKGDKFELSVPLSSLTPEGKIEFKFVVNGKYWAEPNLKYKNRTPSGNWTYRFNYVLFK
ncbi:MAG: glycogen-binding domain-containing protein [Bacteroidia bacterium]|nr:glycogen-binding domain-containing protein [Bacteroidia bacterium]MCF8426473.1 glycogen-binding domain-containing protein [Bacteroidia bacterium]MCF8448114.1 glycogen-binding domain-containing protein [Bacteroidia bacterium]